MIDKFVSHYQRNRLFRHIFWVLLIKFMLLAWLWASFIKPNKVHPTVDSVSSHILIEHQDKAAASIDRSAI